MTSQRALWYYRSQITLTFKMEFPLAGQKIMEITVTPIPAHYHKMVGRPAFAENIGSQRTEWLVRAGTDGGLEGLTIANRFMQQFRGFESSDGTVPSLASSAFHTSPMPPEPSFSRIL